MAKERAELDEEPRTDDSIEEAQAKSRSVDERVPERSPGPGPDQPIPASHVPQAGIGLPPIEDLGEGERVLEDERKERRTPRSS